MYINNLYDFGHLVRTEDSLLPVETLDFYQISKNPLDWQSEYLHENFFKYLSGDLKPEQVCTDTYRFRVVSDRFCDDLINIMENYGQWSSENDIHMSQVGLHDEWLYFLTNAVSLLQKLVFPYYDSDVSNCRIFHIKTLIE